MALEYRDQVFGIGPLSLVGIGVGLRIVVGRALYLPLRGIACLYELNLFVGEVLLKCRESFVEVGEGTLEVGIVRGADDVVVDLVLLQTIEKATSSVGLLAHCSVWMMIFALGQTSRQALPAAFSILEKWSQCLSV